MSCEYIFADFFTQAVKVFLVSFSVSLKRKMSVFFKSYVVLKLCFVYVFHDLLTFYSIGLSNA